MPPRRKKPTRSKPIAPPRAKSKVRAKVKAKPKAAARKATSRRSAAKPRTVAKPKRQTRTAAKPKRPARKPAARRRAPQDERPSLLTFETTTPEEIPTRAQPVGVGAARAMWETDDAPAAESIPAAAVTASTDAAPHVDRPLAELACGTFALLLALSVFFPWYHNIVGTVSGWSSGTWGPIVFFLALAALGIVILRRAGRAVEFPIEPTLMLEGIGWLCVLALIVKRYRPPSIEGVKLPSDGWIFASLMCAFGLAVMAGGASSNAPFVVRKTWLRDTAGKLGAALLVVALVAGISVGFVNKASIAGPTPGPSIVAPQFVRGLPKCATRLHIPTPAGFTATQGYDFKNNQTCIVYYSTSLKLDPGFSRFVAALRTARWVVTPGKPTVVSRQAGIKGAGCGSLAIVVQSGRSTTAYVNVLPCPTTK